MNKGQRIEDKLKKILRVLIIAGLLYLIYVAGVQADELSERIERMQVEFSRKLQREPIVVELKGAFRDGEDTVVNNFYITNVTNIVRIKNVTNNYYSGKK